MMHLHDLHDLHKRPDKLDITRDYLNGKPVVVKGDYQLTNAERARLSQG